MYDDGTNECLLLQHNHDRATFGDLTEFLNWTALLAKVMAVVSQNNLEHKCIQSVALCKALSPDT